MRSLLRSSSVAGIYPHLIIVPFAPEAGIHPVIAPGDNLKGGVFVPWRVALYVAGDEASVLLPLRIPAIVLTVVSCVHWQC